MKLANDIGNNYSLNLKSSKDFIINIVVAFMVIATVIDMGGGLYLKYISYVLGVILVLLFHPKIYDKNGCILFGTLYCLGPIMAFFIGLSNGAEIRSAIIQFTPFIPAIFFFFLINRGNVQLALRSCILGLVCISVLTIVIYYIFILNPSLMTSISSFMDQHNMGFFGNKNIEGIFFPNVYFKSVLFIDFAFVISVYENKRILSLILFVGILLSFSRSATLCAILSFFLLKGKIFRIYGDKLLFNRSRVIILVALLLLVVCAIMYWVERLDVFFDYFINALTGKSETTIVRIQHFESIVKLFQDNPFYLIFGQGLGTTFYTTGFGYFTDNVEIDHINTIRKFGLVWSTLFYLFIFWEINSLGRSIKKDDRVLGLAYLLTFILVGTNPLLINPLFLILTIIVYKYIIYKNNDLNLCANL